MGNCMYKKVSLVPLIIFALCADAGAISVVQMPFVYDFGVAQGLQCSNEFVICDKYDRSAPVPSLPPIDIPVKISPALPSPSQEEGSVDDETTGPPTLENNESTEKTVLFGFDSSRVRDGESLSLLAEELRADSSVIGISIKGFTCDLGGKTYNDHLAKRRAWAVASLVGRTGLKILDVSGEGKCCYIRGERKLSRRAEISVVRGAGPSSHAPERFTGVDHVNAGSDIREHHKQERR